MSDLDDLEWARAELLEEQARSTELLTRAEKAEAEVERLKRNDLDQRAILLNVQTLATQWAILRAYGSAAYELNRVLAGGPVNQPAESCPCGSCARPCTEPVTCPDGHTDCEADDHMNPPTVNGEVI